MTQIPVEYLFSTKNITCIGEHGNTYRPDACRDSFSFGFKNQKIHDIFVSAYIVTCDNSKFSPYIIKFFDPFTVLIFNSNFEIKTFIFQKMTI